MGAAQLLFVGLSLLCAAEPTSREAPRVDPAAPLTPRGGASGERPRAEENSRASAILDYHKGRLQEAAGGFESASVEAPRDPKPLLDAAVVYRELDNHARSRDLFRAAAALAPGDPDVQAALGWAALRAGELPEAQKAFAEALRLESLKPSARLGKAHLELRLHRPEDALATLEPLAEKRPDLTAAHVLRARANEATGQRGRAIRAYEAAFRSDPAYAEVRLWLGPLYKKLRRYNEAWKQYARVLNVDPNHAQARAEYSSLLDRITKPVHEIMPGRRQKRFHPVRAARGSRKMPVIRVAIGTTINGAPAAKKELAFIASGPFAVIDPETRRTIMKGPAKSPWRARQVRLGKGWAYELVDAAGKRRLSYRRVIAVAPVDRKRHSIIFQRLDLDSGTAWEASGDRQLKGIVELRAHEGRGLYLVNQLPLEDYVYGVINGEMPSHFPGEAQKAQAVIARNHALYTARVLKKHSRHKFDLCDGQHCQVYTGVSGESANGRRAVEATRGLILAHGGAVAQTPYSSNCGGHTQDSGEVPNWGSEPYLRGRKDASEGPAERKSPWELELWVKDRPPVFCNVPKYMHPAQFRWSRVITAEDLAERLRRREKDFGLLRRIRVLKRSVSGNVNKLEFLGTRGTYVADQEQRIRSILGLGSVRSTMLTLEVDRDGTGAPTDIFLFGGGWGHGVGLCQLGAAGRAEGGQGYKKILAHYYAGTKLKSLGY